MSKDFIILLTVVILTVSLGCIGAYEAQQPSSPNQTLQDEPVNASTVNETEPESKNTTVHVEPNITATVEYGTTLVWTHQRYGEYDNIVVNGGNCVWMFIWETDDISREDITIHQLDIHGNWTGDRIDSIREMDVRLMEEHGDVVVFSFWEVVQAPMHETFPGWNTTEDWPLYGIVSFYPPDEIHRPLVHMRVGFHVYIDYEVPHEIDEDEIFEFRNGSCT